MNTLNIRINLYAGVWGLTTRFSAIGPKRHIEHKAINAEP